MRRPLVRVLSIPGLAATGIQWGHVTIGAAATGLGRLIVALTGRRLATAGITITADIGAVSPARRRVVLASCQMALGDLTKQLAQQALSSSMKDVLEAGAKPAGPVQGENVCATIVGQVQAMQNALKEDQELIVLVNAGAETIRVLEFFVPSWRVLVLTGIDTNKNITRIVSPVESTQLICKVMKAQSSAKPVRIAFITPKPKSE